MSSSFANVIEKGEIAGDDIGYRDSHDLPIPSCIAAGFVFDVKSIPCLQRVVMRGWSPPFPAVERRR